MIREPLISVWPAVTEAMYLLSFSVHAQRALWETIASEGIGLASLDSLDVVRIGALMWKYRDLPMDLADAALVRVAERDGISKVFTLDRRDFSVYRPAKIGRFLIIP